MLRSLYYSTEQGRRAKGRGTHLFAPPYVHPLHTEARAGGGRPEKAQRGNGKGRRVCPPTRLSASQSHLPYLRAGKPGGQGEGNRMRDAFGPPLIRGAAG